MTTATDILLEKLEGFSDKAIAAEINRRNGKPDDYQYAMFPPRANLAISLAKLILADKIPLEFKIKRGEVQGNVTYRIYGANDQYVCTIYSTGSVTFG